MYDNNNNNNYNLYNTRPTNKLLLSLYPTTALVKRTSVVKLPTHVAASYVHAYYTRRSPSSLLSWKDIITIIMTLSEQLLIVVGVRIIQRALGLRETKTIKPESFDEIV